MRKILTVGSIMVVKFRIRKAPVIGAIKIGRARHTNNE